MQPIQIRDPPLQLRLVLDELTIVFREAFRYRHHREIFLAKRDHPALMFVPPAKRTVRRRPRTLVARCVWRLWMERAVVVAQARQREANRIVCVRRRLGKSRAPERLGAKPRPVYGSATPCARLHLIERAIQVSNGCR